MLRWKIWLTIGISICSQAIFARSIEVANAPADLTELDHLDKEASTAKDDVVPAWQQQDRPLGNRSTGGLCSYLGFMFHTGIGAPRNDASAVFWYACGQAESALARRAANHEQKVIDGYHKAAEQGDVTAQYYLGRSYETGQSVPKDHKMAAQWYRKAAERSYAPAQYNLGLMYEEGRGVSQDDGEAAKWYRKAADTNYPLAQNELGVMYRFGRGVPQDDAEAVRLYRKAAEQGLAVAQYNMGRRYQVTAMGISSPWGNCLLRRTLIGPPLRWFF